MNYFSLSPFKANTYFVHPNTVAYNTPNVYLSYTDKVFPPFRGLISEKPDDSLFFLDVGQPSKAESAGKCASIHNLDGVLDQW